jgi:hypothetical protein
MGEKVCFLTEVMLTLSSQGVKNEVNEAEVALEHTMVLVV